MSHLEPAPPEAAGHTVDAAMPSIGNLERKAASLLFLTAALILGAMLYLMYARGAFEPTQTLILTADDSEGVTVGMDVTFSGFPIGRVRRLELAPDGNVRIVVDVPRKDAHWLRETSVFTLVKGLVGGTTIKAYSGVLQDPPLPDGAERPVLRGDATAELPQMMATAKDLLANLSQLTSSDSDLGLTLRHLREVGGKLNGQGGAMEVLLGTPENAQQTVRMLERANQLLVRLDQMAVRADQQVFDANGVMPQLRALVAETRTSMQKLDAILLSTQNITANVDTATTDVGQLRNEVESNLRRLEDMLTDLQRRWPFQSKAEVHLP